MSLLAQALLLPIPDLAAINFQTNLIFPNRLQKTQSSGAWKLVPSDEIQLSIDCISTTYRRRLFQFVAASLIIGSRWKDRSCGCEVTRFKSYNFCIMKEKNGTNLMDCLPVGRRAVLCRFNRDFLGFLVQA